MDNGAPKTHVSLDLDAFECPICLALFQGSIFQCKNGHVVCEACRVRIRGTCPSCREPVGDIRCRALENAIAGMALPCSFRSHGCPQLLKHTERRDHEAFLCHHAPFVCPFQRCVYSGPRPLLYDHIQDAHTSSIHYVVSLGLSAWRVRLDWSTPFEVLLDPTDRRVFLLLNGGGVRSGRSLSVVCLGPRPAANELPEYKLEVDGAGQLGALSLSSGSVPCMRSWARHATDGFLFVPDVYWTSLYSAVGVNVHVQKSTVNNASLTTPCSFSEVDTYWSSLLRWVRHLTPETHDPLFMLRVFSFVLFTVAVMLLAIGSWLLAIGIGREDEL